jgi:hypothetical protein
MPVVNVDMSHWFLEELLGRSRITFLCFLRHIHTHSPERIDLLRVSQIPSFLSSFLPPSLPLFLSFSLSFFPFFLFCGTGV